MKHVPRFYVEAEMAQGREIFLSSDQMHHANGVLRLSPGDVVRIFNCRCGEWNCEIINPKKKSVRCLSIFRQPKVEKGPIIACSPINPKRFDFLVEKVTELGVSEIVPIVSDFTQHRNINPEKLRHRVTLACEQSCRLSVPTVRNITKLNDFLEKYSRDYKILVGDERFSGFNLREVIEEKCAFLIGPEGGFSDEENNKFDKCKNLCKFSLGSNILRSETAAIAFISIWSSKFL